MALYALTVDNNRVIYNGTTTIPDSSRLWNDYQAWLAAGNTPDAYVPPIVVAATPSPTIVPTYTLATLPSPSLMGLIQVTDLKDGTQMCYSDGTNWRRQSDQSIAN